MGPETAWLIQPMHSINTALHDGSMVRGMPGSSRIERRQQALRPWHAALQSQGKAAMRTCCSAVTTLAM